MLRKGKKDTATSRARLRGYRFGCCEGAETERRGAAMKKAANVAVSVCCDPVRMR